MKAMAIYAATTLSLPTKGAMKLIQETPSFTSLPANANVSKRFPREKVRAALASDVCTAVEPQVSWLRSREINALKSR
jgi:hypothetical protein